MVAGLINVHFAIGGGDLVTNTGLLCLGKLSLINLRWVTILLTGKVKALYSKVRPPPLLKRRPNNPKTAHICHNKLHLSHELQCIETKHTSAGLLTSCKLVLCSRLTKLLPSKCEQMTKTKIYDDKPVLLSDMVTTDTK